MLIARLDLLARNVFFVTKLLKSKVEFIGVEMPLANKVMVQMMAVFAEYEWDQISIRTHLALQAAKRKGVELGTYGKYVLSQKKPPNGRCLCRQDAAIDCIIERQWL